jgi:uncharacterized protein (UPF0335 family)
MKIDPAALRTFLDAMHAHADIRDQRTKSIAGVVTDARAKGIDGKALRKVFVRERMEPEKRQREDDTLRAYEDALGGKGRALRAIANGATLDEAAEIGGVHRATVARASAVAKQASNATPPHDPETGEIAEYGEEVGVNTPRHTPGSRARRMPDEEVSAPNSGTHSEEQGDRQSPLRDGGAPVATSTAGPAVTTPPDDLAIPVFLQRSAA